MHAHFRRTSALIATTTALALGSALAPLGGTATAATTEPTPVTITQNYSQTLSWGLGCNSGGGSGYLRETQWLRRFNLTDDHTVTKGFHVTSVNIGLDTVTTVGRELPAKVIVAAIDPADAMTMANIEPLATVDVTWAGTLDDTLASVPVDVVVPAGKQMVLEVSMGDLAAGEKFTMSANSGAELQEDFLRAPACGYDEPGVVDGMGSGSRSHVLYASGVAVDCTDAIAAVTVAAAKLTKAKNWKKKVVGTLNKARARYVKAVSQSGKDSRAAKSAKAQLSKASKTKLKVAKKVRLTRKALEAAEAASVSECAQPQLPS